MFLRSITYTLTRSKQSFNGKYINKYHRYLPCCFITTEEIEHYKKDSLTLARWLDVTIVKRKGRAYPADRNLIELVDSVHFPPLKCFSLNGENIIVPDYYNNKNKTVKLVVFSFKHYGFTLIRSFLDPFLEKYRSQDKNKDITIIEICFIEYSFLSMAKSVFGNNIKNQINSSQIDYTVMTFGSVMVYSILY